MHFRWGQSCHCDDVQSQQDGPVRLCLHLLPDPFSGCSPHKSVSLEVQTLDKDIKTVFNSFRKK